MPSKPEILDTRSQDGLTVKLIHDTGMLGEDEWLVVLGDSSGFVDRPCGDEYEARIQFRRICSEIGIPMPYEAPRFETPIQAPAADPLEEAAAIYYDYHGRLNAFYPGSDESHAIRNQMRRDPAFIKCAAEILSLTPENSSHWIVASIRACCHRIAAQAKAEQERELHDLANFGAF